MSLIKCPECKKKISEKAKGCPSCGYVLNPSDVKKQKNDARFGWLIFIVLILLVAACPDNDDTVETESKFTTARLNLRKGPGTDFDIIKSLSQGESITINTEEQENGFVMVVDGSDKEVGWVSVKHLSGQPLIDIKPYEVLNLGKNLPYKMAYDLSIPEKYSQNDLAHIRDHLIKNSEKADKYFISFYLPGMEIGGGAWAMANSGDNVNIMEFMLEQNSTSID